MTSKVLSNRMKNLLLNLISSNQKQAKTGTSLKQFGHRFINFGYI